MIFTSLNEKLHDTRRKNMELRESQAKQQVKQLALIKANKELTSEIQTLRKKQADDCDTILQNVKELQKLSHSHR